MWLVLNVRKKKDMIREIRRNFVHVEERRSGRHSGSRYRESEYSKSTRQVAQYPFKRAA